MRTGRPSVAGVCLFAVVMSACGGTTAEIRTTSAPPPSGAATAAPAIRAVTTPQATAHEASPTVELAEHFYSPSPITVKAGATVTWRNVGVQTHDVNADDGSFKSGNLEPGDSFSYTFTTPGRFKYFCIPHAGDGMTGEVVVEPR